MPLTLQTLAIGTTASEACYKFNYPGASIGIYCDPLFQTSSASTISWVAYYDNLGNLPISPSWVSNGTIVRYFDGFNLGPAITSACQKSQYVRGCCDSKLYKLSSGDELVLDTLIIVSPYNFCYKVVEFNSQPYLTLNDTVGKAVVSPTLDCSYGECQPCPPTTTTTTTSNVPIPGQSENECGPITLLPLGVQCNIINEPTENGYDGILSVYVTGGTAPYTVVWTLPDTLSITGGTIFNQPEGTYIVNVKDLWGDFTASTTCELTSPVNCGFDGSVSVYPIPTPTTTTTTTNPQPPIQPTPIVPTPPPSPSPTPTPTPSPQPKNITWEHFKECPNCSCAKTSGYINLNGNPIYQFNSGTPCGAPTNGNNFTINVGDVIDIYISAQVPIGGCSVYYSTAELIVDNGFYANTVTSNSQPNDISYTLTVTSGNINTINSIEIISGCNG